jgi:hypothetical protein
MRAGSLVGHGGPFALAVSIAIASLAGAAHADVTEPIRIEVTAPDGCPGRDAFVAEVTARTAKARIAGPGEQARAFTVTIVRAGKRARGALVIDDPRGPGGAREVSGESCGEVASALALVTALAIDPKAKTAARLPPPPPRAPRAPAAPSRPPPVVPLTPPRAPRPPPPFTRSPWWGPIGEPLPAAPTPPPRARSRFAIALRGGVASALAPRLLPVIGASIEIARVDAGVLAPTLRLSMLRADSSAELVGAGPQRARFRSTLGRLEGCPLRIEIVPRLTALPCALFEAGALSADGSSPFSPASATRPWLAPGALGRVQVDVIGDLVVEVEGGAVFPIVRDTFLFAPSLVAHEVPVAGGFVGGGVGVHFP